MKKIFTLMLVLSAFVSSAQKIELPHDSKVMGRCYPTMATPVPCGGVGYLNNAPDWRPRLSNKNTEFKHGAPIGNLDSIKAVQWLIKQDFEKKRINAAAKTTAETPVMGVNFSGYAPDGSYPLDNSVAVSNGGIVIAVENSTISGFNANTGVGLFNTSLNTFLPFTGIYDVSSPVVLYDSTKDRFILFCQEMNASGVFSNNRIFLCFSQTNNPATGGWWCYSFTGDPAGTANGFDFPRLAINDSEVFITGNLYYEPSNTFNKAIIFEMDKLAGFSGGSMSYLYYGSIIGSPFTILPVSNGHGANLTSGMLMVSTVPTGGSYFNLYSVSGSILHSPTLTWYNVTSTPYTAPADAMQMGTATTLNTGDCRALSGFFLDGIIHFVFNCSSGGYTSINYNRITVATLANTSSIFSMSGFDCAYPAIASFATSPTDRSVMIGFGRSGSTIAPEIRVVNCDNAMTWSASTLVKSNLYVSYTGSTASWGDYSGIARKHNSTNASVWMSGAYGNGIHHWTTWLSEIHTGVTPCPDPTGLTATSITTTSALLGWTAVSGALGYNIHYRKAGTIPWTTTSASGTTKTITSLTPSTTYEYDIETRCPGPVTSGYSDSSSFTTLTPASISSFTTAGSKVYPNPVTDLFTLEFSLEENMPLNVSVVDMTGRLVKELYNGDAAAGDNVFSFNKANLTPGIYMLVIKSHYKTIKNEKIIIAD